MLRVVKSLSKIIGKCLLLSATRILLWSSCNECWAWQSGGCELKTEHRQLLSKGLTSFLSDISSAPSLLLPPIMWLLQMTDPQGLSHFGWTSFLCYYWFVSKVKVYGNIFGRTQMCFFLSLEQFLILSKPLSCFCRLHALFLITASFLFLAPLLGYLITFTLTFKWTANLQSITKVILEPCTKGHIGSYVGNSMAWTRNKLGFGM